MIDSNMFINKEVIKEDIDNAFFTCISSGFTLLGQLLSLKQTNISEVPEWLLKTIEDNLINLVNDYKTYGSTNNLFMQCITMDILIKMTTDDLMSEDKIKKNKIYVHRYDFTTKEVNLKDEA